MSTLRQFNTPISLSSAALSATHNSNTLGSLFTTGGNVGIGTISPLANLEISTLNSTTLSLHAATTGTSMCSIELNRNTNIFGSDPNRDYRLTNSGGQFLIQEGISTTIGTLFALFDDLISYRPLRIISSSGSSLGAALQVNHNTLHPMNGSVTPNNAFGIRVSGSTSGIGTTGCSWIFSQNEDLGLSLFLHQASTNTYLPTTGFTISTTGNIGIGTTSPSYTLDVNGSSRLESVNFTSTSLNFTKLSGSSRTAITNIQTTTNTTNRMQLYMYGKPGDSNQSSLDISSQTKGMYLITTEKSGTPPFYPLSLGINSIEYLTVATTGDVGINTTAPSFNLDINGSTRIGNSASNSLQNYDNLILTPLSGHTVTEISFNPAPGPFRNWIYSNSPLGMAIGGHGGLAFQTGPSGGSVSTNMFITTSGNVCIDTTTPNAILNIGNGNPALSVTTANIAFSYWAGGYNHYITSRHKNTTSSNQNALDFWLNDSTSANASSSPNVGNVIGMSVTATGVGIGTTDPLYSLQVDGNVALNVMPGINSVGSIKIGRQDFNARWHMINCNNGTTASLNTMIFNLHDAVTSTSITPVLALRGDGRVGINVTAPAYALDVNGTIDASIYTGGSISVTSITTGTLRLTSMTATNILISGNVDASGQFLGQANDTVTSASFSWTGDTNTGIYRPLADTIGFVTSGVDRFRLASNGNLLMAGAANNNYGINMPTGGYGIHWQTGSSGVSRIYDDGDLRICTDDNMRFYTGSSGSTPGTERMTLNSTGVGIGTNGQVSTLCLNGNAVGNGVLQVVSISNTINSGRSQDGASFRAWNDGNIIIDFYNSAGTSRGTIYGSGSGAVTYNTSSDRRLKKDVINMSSAINLIKQMRPIEFTWISDNKVDFGFIAQEIYELFPRMRPNFSSYSHCECDTTDISNGILCSCEEHNHDEPLDKDGNPLYYGLDYGRFTPYLTKALQETISELETSQQTIQSQAMIISQLQSQISSQQQQINDILTRLS
jgi:hypothetical protein